MERGITSNIEQELLGMREKSENRDERKLWREESQELGGTEESQELCGTEREI